MAKRESNRKRPKPSCSCQVQTPKTFVKTKTRQRKNDNQAISFTCKENRVCVLLHAPNCSASLCVLLSFISSGWLQKGHGGYSCTTFSSTHASANMVFLFKVGHSQGSSYLVMKQLQSEVVFSLGSRCVISLCRQEAGSATVTLCKTQNKRVIICTVIPTVAYWPGPHR